MGGLNTHPRPGGRRGRTKRQQNGKKGQMDVREEHWSWNEVFSNQRRAF
jgi:hypothetical protein